LKSLHFSGPIPPQQGLEDEGCGYGLDVFGIHQDRAQPEVLEKSGKVEKYDEK
jgi:hypothetical protein